MAYVAVQRWGDEVMFHNRPTRKEDKRWQYLSYWQDDEVYQEIRELTTFADDDYSIVLPAYDYSIVLPKGTIKKLIGRDMTWKDEPVELLSD